MSILSHHAIRSRLNLDRLDEYAKEDVPFVSDAEVESALAAGEFSIREAESVISELKAVSLRLAAERGATINDVDMIERVAGESLVSKGVRSVLTSQPTELYYHEVRVATEALSDKIKIGIIITIITIIIKIIGWIMGSSKDAKMTDWAAEVKKIPERIETSETFKDKAYDVITSRIWREQLEIWRKKLGDSNSRPIMFTNLLVLVTMMEDITERTMLIPKGSGEKNMMEALLKHRGVDLAADMMEEYVTNYGLDEKPEGHDCTRAIIASAVKNNLFASCFKSDHKDFADISLLWYGDDIGKLDSIFGYTGWRLFSDQAFDYFRSPKHGQHLKTLEYQLNVTQKALKDFENDLARKKDFPFECNIGFIDERWYDGSVPPGQKGKLPTLSEAPLLWGPAYVTHALGAGAYGSLNGVSEGGDRIWFNEFVSSAIFSPDMVISERAAHTFVLSTVNTGGGNRTRTTYKNDNTLEKIREAVDKTHSTTNIEMRLIIGDMDVIDANNAMDGIPSKHHKRDTNDYFKPAIYIPTVNCVPRKATDLSTIYSMTDNATYAVADCLVAIGNSRAGCVADAAKLDVAKYDGTYKQLEKCATAILKQMKGIESKATRGHQTLNATYKSHYTPDTVRSVDALVVMWWVSDHGRAPSMTTTNSISGNIRFPREKLDEVGDMYRVENPWFALKDTLETAKIISRVSGYAKKVAEELGKSPLIGLRW